MSTMTDTDLMDLAYRANPGQKDAVLRASLPGLRAVAAAAWDEGRGSLAMDIASPMREDMTKRSTENPYRSADKENPA